MEDLPWRTSGGRGRLWSVGVSLAVLLAGAPSSSRAASFAVDRADDEPAATVCTGAPNDCSLRGAILAANALAPEASDISLPAGTYLLSQAAACSYRLRGNPNLMTSTQLPLCLNAPVTISGDGAATTVIDANLLDRVIFVAADAIAEIRGVTITNGNLTGFSFGVVGGGGGVNNQGTLTLADSIVSDNAAFTTGGGIYNAGQLTLMRATVRVNSQLPNAGAGGGIYNDQQSSLTVVDSTISNNIVTANGGGIANFQGTVAILSSTVSGNTAGQLGGGIANFGGSFVGKLTITNSTISGNQTGSLGGGIYNHQSAETHLQSVTIANNVAGQDASSSAGGGIANSNSLVNAAQHTDRRQHRARFVWAGLRRVRLTGGGADLGG